jgi:hypothetical protein
MSLDLRLRFLTRDHRGRILQDTGERQSRSYTKGLLNVMTAILGGSRDIPDITGAIQTTVPGSQSMTLGQLFGMDGDAGDDLTGIVVGSGDTAEDATDLSLEARIEAATLYPSVHAWEIFDTPTHANIVATRAFSNLSPAPVPVRETGIQVYDLATRWWLVVIGYQTYYPYLPITEIQTAPYNWYGLIARDVLDTTYTIPEGGAGAAIYMIRIPL